MNFYSEKKHDEKLNIVDYGPDIDILVQREKFLPNITFHPDDIEKMRENILENERRRVLSRTHQKPNEWVTEKLIGKGSKGYYIKNWVKYRGKGTERVNDTFRKILENSHKPHKLNDNVRARLHLGPRIASLKRK